MTRQSHFYTFLFAALICFTATPPVVNAEPGGFLVLKQGQVAPFTGILQTPSAAAKVRAKLEQMRLTRTEADARIQEAEALYAKIAAQDKLLAISQERTEAYKELSVKAERAARAQRNGRRFERLLLGILLFLK